MKSRPLRLLHVSKFYPPDHGGIEYFVRDLAEAQARAGHDVLVLAHAGRAAAGVETPAARLCIERQKVWFSLGKYAPVAPALLWAVVKAAWLYRPDIVHLHCPNPLGLALLAAPLKIPVIIHWHADVVFPQNYEPPRWLMALWRRLEKAVLKRADSVIVTSPDYAATSVTLRGYQHKCRAVPLGLPEAPPPLKAEPGRVARWLGEQAAGSRIVAIGRLAHFKGFAVLLEAMTRLPHATLCLIGDGEERGHLETLRRELGLEERVFLAGAADPAECEAALQASDIFCLPSITRAESFGMVLLEAMRAGKACVATDVPGSGMGFVLREGETGLLARAGSPDSLADVLAVLLNNPQQRARYAEAGRENFVKNFAISSVQKQIERVYGEVYGRV